MGNNSGNSFKNYHPRIGMIGAYLLARRVLESEGCSADDLASVQKQLIKLIRNWIYKDYAAVSVQLPKDDQVGWLFDKDFWLKVRPDFNDVVDAITVLRTAEYSKLRVFINESRETQLFLAIIFLAIEYQTKASGDKANLLRQQCDLVAHKCITSLVLLVNGPFIDMKLHQDEQELLQSAALEALEEERIEQARKGGQARAAKLKKLRSFVVCEFNRKKFGTMRQGSVYLAPKVKNQKESKVLKTKDFQRRVYEWLIEENKLGSLYKKF